VPAFDAIGRSRRNRLHAGPDANDGDLGLAGAMALPAHRTRKGRPARSTTSGSRQRSTDHRLPHRPAAAHHQVFGGPTLGNPGRCDPTEAFPRLETALKRFSGSMTTFRPECFQGPDMNRAGPRIYFWQPPGMGILATPAWRGEGRYKKKAGTQAADSSLSISLCGWRRARPNQGAFTLTPRAISGYSPDGPASYL